MTRFDAFHRLPNSSPRFRAWLAATLLSAGCYAPASMIDDTDTDTDATSGSGSSGEDSVSGTDTNPPTATTSDDESSDDGPTSVDDDGSSGDTTTVADSSDSGEASDSDESSTGDVADTTPPTILSISPADGDAGVASDVDIVVTFDEPMDTATTEAAFDAADIGPFAASWNGDGTVLTIAPAAPLAYANGADPDDVVALAYDFAIAATATDVAGNALAAETTSSFTTSRRITTTLASDVGLTGAVLSNGVLNSGAGGDAVAGDGTDNLQRKGFFALVLDDVPDGAEVESASLDAQQYLTLGAPFTTLGTLGIGHITADALDLDAFSDAALADLGVFSSSATDGARTADIAATVAVDLAAGRTRSQYRVQFTSASDGDAATDRTRFDEPAGTIVYLVE